MNLQQLTRTVYQHLQQLASTAPGNKRRVLHSLMVDTLGYPLTNVDLGPFVRNDLGNALLLEFRRIGEQDGF